MKTKMKILTFSAQNVKKQNTHIHIDEYEGMMYFVYESGRKQYKIVATIDFKDKVILFLGKENEKATQNQPTWYIDPSELGTLFVNLMGG